MATQAEIEHPRKAFGWAARDPSGVLSPFNFSRREPGEKDVAFKVLYCGICHSDLHNIKNEWGTSTYPMVPGVLNCGPQHVLRPQYCGCSSDRYRIATQLRTTQSLKQPSQTFFRADPTPPPSLNRSSLCTRATTTFRHTSHVHGTTHEIVGVVTEVGSKVEKFKVGDKVGVGCLVDSCRTCHNCSDNLENYCPKFTLTYRAKYKDGTITYGGYSDSMVADEHFVIRIPDGLPLDAAAPLLCAGITVYSPLKYYGLDKPGLHVGVVGLGGLGHVAVKFAKAFGAKVTVISTSPNKRDEAIQNLGADSFLISRDQDQMQAAMGSLDGIIDTVSAVHPILPLIGLLKSHGKLVMVGAPDKPLELPVFPLLRGRKIVAGSIIGGLKETQEMIDFAAKQNVKPDIEVIPMEYVNTAMERLVKADVKYRFVIDIGNTLKTTS